MKIEAINKGNYSKDQTEVVMWEKKGKENFNRREEG
jgi:hypothetical protein